MALNIRRQRELTAEDPSWASVAVTETIISRQTVHRRLDEKALTPGDRLYTFPSVHHKRPPVSSVEPGTRFLNIARHVICTDESRFSSPYFSR
ncbi:hypothetical protein AVEN_70479-1 [Araneus ventricosus]|uniref:Uncharacterized protein n=1 Tax=Araneus ventricosus TaxID=182803 RepID=A0A4Y2H353_ARAVE|nr:hypothetical protein AVEN_70479-1 [Araneus ventricosus]